MPFLETFHKHLSWRMLMTTNQFTGSCFEIEVTCAVVFSFVLQQYYEACLVVLFNVFDSAVIYKLCLRCKMIKITNILIILM